MKTLLSTIIIYCGLFAAISSALAQTWTQNTNAPNMAWLSIAASADGSKLAALPFGGATGVIWVSTNAGINWTSNNVPGVPDAGALASVAWSATGDKLAVVAQYASYIFTSTNYGGTWASNSVPSETWFRIASSADGTRLVAVAGNSGSGPIYFSADSGQTWTQANAPITNWVSVASSANGSNWVAAAETFQSPPGGSIYTSTNSGLDWTLMTGAPNLQYFSVASSADGTKLIAAGAGVIPGINGVIYTSTNSGASWISNSLPNEFWSRVASSASGRTLAATAFTDTFGNSGFIYTSTNSGTTWNTLEKTPMQNWNSIISSADGGILVAAGETSPINPSGGGIYFLQTVPAPEMNVALATTNLTLSWIIPSTNFVLQQCTDLISWSSITNTPTLNFNNLQNQITLAPTNSNGFFRLISQ